MICPDGSMDRLDSSAGDGATKSDDRSEPVVGILAAAAGGTLFVGLAGSVMGGAHLEGVIQTALTKVVSMALAAGPT